MSKRKRPGTNTFPPPDVRSFHKPSHAIFAAIKPLLESTLGYEFDYGYLGRLLGVPHTTAWRWCSEHDDEHVRALFCLLELLPLKQRHAVIDSFCRSRPNFRHAKLSHDPLAVSLLEGVLARSTGLTILRGGPGHMRRFLLAALANEFSRLDSTHREVCGIDIQPPDRVLPTLGVHYRQERLSLASRVRSFVHSTRSFVEESGAPLVVLNGVWTSAPDLKTKILEIALTRHVIAADHFATVPSDIRNDTQSPITVINVSPTREQPKWIRVLITAVE